MRDTEIERVSVRARSSRHGKGRREEKEDKEIDRKGGRQKTRKERIRGRGLGKEQNKKQK